MAGQKQDDLLEHTFSRYVRIWDVALKTCQRQWTIGRSGERGSGISVQAAWHDIYIYICIYVCEKLAAIDEGDQMAPFSTATTRRCVCVWGGLPLSLDCSILPSIRTLYGWMLSKDVSSTIFKVFGMTWPGIEPGSSESLANTIYKYIYHLLIYIYHHL